MKAFNHNRLNMLLACGSPGSALAYHLAPSLRKIGMVRRNMNAATPAAGFAPVGSAPLGVETVAQAPVGVLGWIARLFDKLEQRAWEAEMRDREAYLSKAANVYDLESRMRHIETNRFGL